MWCDQIYNLNRSLRLSEEGLEEQDWTGRPTCWEAVTVTQAGLPGGLDRDWGKGDRTCQTGAMLGLQ